MPLLCFALLSSESLFHIHVACCCGCWLNAALCCACVVGSKVKGEDSIWWVLASNIRDQFANLLGWWPFNNHPKEAVLPSADKQFSLYDTCSARCRLVYDLCNRLAIPKLMYGRLEGPFFQKTPVHIILIRNLKCFLCGWLFQTLLFIYH